MSESSRLAGVFGSLAVIGVAGLLVPARDWLDPTNVALVLVVVIAGAAATGGRGAGALTSVMAALSFNFFHTQPYYSLRISDRDDIVTTVLLLVVGVSVGEIATLRTRSRREATVASGGTRRLEDVAAAIATGRDAESVWPVVRQALVEQFRLAECRFEPAPFEAGDELPRLQRDGRLPATEHVFTGEGFELPPHGVEVLVEVGPTLLGRLVLVPTPHAGATRAERKVVVALADQFAVAVARTAQPRVLT
jgi:K+-sensing histidine kinase KdpD